MMTVQDAKRVTDGFDTEVASVVTKRGWAMTNENLNKVALEFMGRMDRQMKATLAEALVVGAMNTWK